MSVDDGTTPTPPRRASARRDRARVATIEEIKSTALDQMRATGTIEVRFADIARAMDLTPPALYRYFADREALLTALIADAYSDLADHLAACRDAAPQAPGARMSAVFGGLREWGHTDPQRFGLIFGPPIATYSAPVDSPSTAGAKRSMAAVESVLVAARDGGSLGTGAGTIVDAGLAEVLLLTRNVAGEPLAAATYQAMISSWIAVHGFVALEIFGHLDWMPPAARDSLFEAHLQPCLVALGLVEGGEGLPAHATEGMQAPATHVRGVE